MRLLLLVLALPCLVLAHGQPGITLDLGAKAAYRQLAAHPKPAGCVTGSSHHECHHPGHGREWMMHYLKCPAKTSTEKSCPLPTAHAFDSEDGNEEVERAFFLVNKDGSTGPTAQVAVLPHTGLPAHFYTQRSEWLVKYSARDSSGNQADTLVFSVVFDDSSKPS